MMGKVIDTIKKALGVKPARKHSFLNVGQAWSNSGHDKFTNYNSYLDAGTGNVWSTFRACDIIGNAVMQTGYNLIRKSDGAVVEGDRTGLQELIEQPNPVDTFEDLMYLYTHHLKLTGNFFLLKDEINPITKLLSRSVVSVSVKTNAWKIWKGVFRRVRPYDFFWSVFWVD